MIPKLIGTLLIKFDPVFGIDFTNERKSGSIGATPTGCLDCSGRDVGGVSRKLALQVAEKSGEGSH